MSGTATPIALANFDALAEDYARYRPGYAPSVLSAILGLVGKAPGAVDAADVGAGTGIWSRMLAERGLRSVVAVEPSPAMFAAGVRDSGHLANLRWQAGTGENTGLAEGSVDLLTMASSFHWVDFAAGVKEFHRALKPGGWFCALWNPRWIEANPLLVEIESRLYTLHPALDRKSSGRSGRTEGLADSLAACGYFDDVIHLEGRQVVHQSVEHYIGAWKSVNDVQAQLGPAKFQAFLDFVRERLAGMAGVETTYLTRAWAARRPSQQIAARRRQP